MKICKIANSIQPVFFVRFEKEGHRLTGAAFVTAEGSRLFGQTLALLRLVILKQSSTIKNWF
jgi:hypothetical protein